MFQHFLITLLLAVSFASQSLAIEKQSSSVTKRKIASVKNPIVETYHPISKKIGLETLEKGGNAFDAFIAATAADYVLGEGVTSIGGPLGALLYDAKNERAEYLDAGFNDPLRSRHWWDFGKKSKPGYLVLVPGAIAGIEALSKKYGKLTFKADLEPAISLAENGFPISDHYARMIAANAEKLKRTPYGLKTFFKDGKPLKTGDPLKLPELAGFLKRLANEGSAFVYSGDWARACLETVNSNGGHLSKEDFSSYKPLWETPLKIRYRGLDLYFPDTHGSIIVSLALKAIESEDLAKFGSHYSESVDGLAYVNENYLQATREPWLYDVSRLRDEAFVVKMLGPENIDRIRSRVQSRTTVSPEPDRGTHSLQVTVIDTDGNAITGTNTIEGLPWGEGLFVDGVALTSSGQITDFETAPGQRRRFGLAMHIGIQDKFLKLISGTFNASLIPAQLQILLNLIDYKLAPMNAATFPRFGAEAWNFEAMKPLGGQWLDPRVSSSAVKRLSERGFKFIQEPPVDTGLGALATVEQDGSAQGAILPMSSLKSGKLVGIGVALAKTEKNDLLITKVISSSPAANAGLAPGDIILTIKSTLEQAPIVAKNISAEKAMESIRGDKGTKIILEILRSSGNVIRVEIARDEFVSR